MAGPAHHPGEAGPGRTSAPPRQRGRAPARLRPREVQGQELWASIEPLLPPWPERSPGPRPVSDRLCLQGILFVLYNHMAWQLLPLEAAKGLSGTRWRAGRYGCTPHSQLVLKLP
ncbi:transposase [Streptomyces cyaneofuscatus]|uniref:transposase n=1 Tax=Streptomyces cyaneofuscatus TaxID=66883 RepID=UPI00378F502A